ncbi:TonB-dependent receptor [Edaphobacter flagellatus]|uniref:TonB-dependent receptor n=1 Tax=Edaphobacter flagellatus TaxID=1933044 RepID=UPI0021B3F704|nr:carboxypeptidase regulatory-like domain-containing protein [Edaphobacter flagellatus]
MKYLPRYIYLFLLVLVSAMTPYLGAQTFRGGIAGTVQDASGAAVPGARVLLTGTDTGFKREMATTSSGDYTFQDIPLGNYSIEVSSQGFATRRVEKIVVGAGQVYALDIKLSVASATEQVDVSADAVAVDTLSTTNTAIVPGQAVANIPLNGRDFTQLIKITPGYNGAGSVNGARTNQNNWQIDGVDNNDIFHNSVGANQGGVSGVAGVTLPIEAIDQFSVQSQGNAEVGRNGGGLINMVVKSGTNKFHGSAYYFFRNEYFAAKSDFLAPSARKPKIRNNQWGGSLGGPVIHDKLFFFLNYEHQKYIIGAQSAATEPTVDWVAKATTLLNNHNVPVSQTSLNLLTALWPQGNKPGPATVNNFTDSRPQTGYSDNAVGKIDWNINSRQTLSARAFIGSGRQLGNAGVNIWEYYQLAPTHVHNYAVTHNWAISNQLSNQALVGINYFGQTFNDNVHNQNIPALGLNTSVTNPALFGAPSISFPNANFDSIGVTPPLGRQDYTGHVTDTATYIIGKHQFRFGGEFRRNYMNLLYQRNVRGGFTFDGQSSKSLATGSSTPYYLDTSLESSPTDQSVRSLADFLAGYAATGTIVRGTLQRDVWVNQWDIFAQDQYQLLPSLTLNYGVRWDYSGPVYTTNGTLSNFNPNSTSGYSVVGADISTLYPRRYTNVSPRFGFSQKVTEKLVVRGTYGLFFDLPNLNGFFDNRPGNGASVGVQANDAGPNPVFTVSKNTPFVIATGVDPLPSSPTSGAIFGVSTVSPSFKNAYLQNFNLNTEYQLSRSTIVQLGYVGSVGRHLFNVRDINQAAPSASPNTSVNASTGAPCGSSTNCVTALQYSRPYFSKFPTFAAINQFESSAGSNYSSLQAMIRTSGFHGLTAQGSYTYGHGLDNVSGTRNLSPQDSRNLAGEYGNADFDTRHTFNGYIVYEIPTFGSFKPLTQGWEVNSFLTFFTGKPVTPKTSSNNSGTGEKQDRATQIANPNTSNRTFTRNSSGAGYVQWFSQAAYTLPAAGTFSPTPRGSVYGPGFGTVDASLVKNTTLYENVKLQLRAEMFNIFNRLNLAPVSGSFGSTNFGRATTTVGDNAGAPGLGSGEPFNVQFAAKIVF